MGNDDPWHADKVPLLLKPVLVTSEQADSEGCRWLAVACSARHGCTHALERVRAACRAVTFGAR